MCGTVCGAASGFSPLKEQDPLSGMGRKILRFAAQVNKSGAAIAGAQPCICFSNQYSAVSIELLLEYYYSFLKDVNFRACSNLKLSSGRVRCRAAAAPRVAAARVHIGTLTAAVQLLLATHNPGKLAEYQRLLHMLPLQWRTLADYNITIKAPEDGSTFLENARYKAAYYSQLSGSLTLADDSGLCVDALHGAPGVHTARYNGAQTPYPEKLAALLAELHTIAWPQRTAKFHCAVALADPHGKIILAGEGECAGRIALAPAGRHGFGYDPLFYMDAARCTMAELADAEKDRSSHRGNAVRALLPQLHALASDAAAQ